MALNVLYTPL